MNRIEAIKQALSTLKPKHIEIIDETHLHIGHLGHKADSEYTHIKLIISDEFGEMKLVDKHRAIKSLLKEEFDKGLHALSIEFVR
jgi:BolA protein